MVIWESNTPEHMKILILSAISGPNNKDSFGYMHLQAPKKSFVFPN